jgi:hypothetical protein
LPRRAPGGSGNKGRSIWTDEDDDEQTGTGFRWQQREQGFSLIGTLKSYRHPQRRISATEHMVEMIGLTVDGRDLRFLMDALRFYSEYRRQKVASVA